MLKSQNPISLGSLTPLVKFAIQKRWDSFRNKNFLRDSLLRPSSIGKKKAQLNSSGVWKVVNATLGNKSSDAIFNLVNQFQSVQNAAEEINKKFSSVFTTDNATYCLETNSERSVKNWTIDFSPSTVE